MICASTHCITCSDEAVAATVVELLPDGFGRVEVGGAATETVCLDLVDACPGDTVLVHAGVALEILP
jgi:hydrogenase maturation factor